LLATEAKRKNEAVIAGAASRWLPRVEQMAKEMPPVAVVRPIFSRAQWWAAITSAGGRNHGEHQP
jgi:hypothetical protein